jgi:O-acetyl-ADP-ribose deacetylase (regulator of RNase III)
MSTAAGAPDPTGVATLADLAREFDKLRRRAARPGQVRLSVRDVAKRIGRAHSTLDPYLRGRRLCPADVYEDILRALGVENAQLRPWLDAWERLAEATAGGRPADGLARRVEPGRWYRRPVPLKQTEEFRYRLADRGGSAGVGIVTGYLRRVQCAQVWVNSENTNMTMARFEEYSVSAIIRFEGAVRDETGHVVGDCIADELSRKVAGRTPVAAGTAIATGSGELAVSNGVRYVIHVAAVQGAPGEGYRQILDIGRCVTSAMAVMDQLDAASPAGNARLRTILFPLLGTGVGGGDLEATVTALLGAALGYFASHDSAERMVYFLAHNDVELEVCRAVFDASPRLVGPE